VWRRCSPAIGAPTTPGTQDPHITNSGQSSGRVACTRSGEIYGGERRPLTGCAGAALKILIVDRTRDPACMVPCAFADVLPAAGATCKTPCMDASRVRRNPIDAATLSQSSTAADTSGAFFENLNCYAALRNSLGYTVGDPCLGLEEVQW
jgi:hypothetical protein